MHKRFLTIWFRYLSTDWFTRRQPNLRELPLVLSVPDHGRMMITAANALAEAQAICAGMMVADARVIIPSLQVLDYKPVLPGKLLKGLAEWCIHYTPLVAIDSPDGLILDITGCVKHFVFGISMNGGNNYERLGSKFILIRKLLPIHGLQRTGGRIKQLYFPLQVLNYYVRNSRRLPCF